MKWWRWNRRDLEVISIKLYPVSGRGWMYVSRYSTSLSNAVYCTRRGVHKYCSTQLLSSHYLRHDYAMIILMQYTTQCTYETTLLYCMRTDPTNSVYCDILVQTDHLNVNITYHMTYCIVYIRIITIVTVFGLYYLYIYICMCSFVRSTYRGNTDIDWLIVLSRKWLMS